ncbi:hypothetical protein SAMN03159423_4892 [Bradyrhizobium sp. NFR13]|uniref:hypothetical protein n=1 Tax=Bradyrhizobium sp. NFR13 TaxID=1566285 RepID=UPI0008F2294D|nr:hypothetical protein [Bradyrhizobium sp. NFR13]SFM00927.1 hypothetical protein SAMN03159423_4892 [Bradyrhizobium sp. NFR13]
MRWIAVLLLTAGVSPATAAKTICRPTFDGFMEFECETKDPPVNAASFCDVMNRQGGPVRWSRNDTEETKNRADLINAAGKRACGWGRR